MSMVTVNEVLGSGAIVEKSFYPKAWPRITIEQMEPPVTGEAGGAVGTIIDLDPCCTHVELIYATERFGLVCSMVRTAMVP